MIKLITQLILICIAIPLIAQDSYKPGYYINLEGQRVTGLIAYKNWSDNPENISFKKEETDNATIISAYDLRGFEITNTARYDLFTVEVAKNSNKTTQLDALREVELEKKVSLIKLLVDGQAQLYEYSKDGVVHFFIRKDDIMTSLLYKRYLSFDVISTNNQFKQQLVNLLSCESGKLPNADNLQYKSSSLIKYVSKYNECNGFTNSFLSASNKSSLDFKILGGGKYESFNVENGGNLSFDYGSQFSYELGVEIELQFTSQTANYWSLFIDGRRSTFKDGIGEVVISNQFTDDLLTSRTTANYSAIDFGLGGRYYYAINEQSHLYFGANVSIDFLTKTVVTYDDFPGIEDVRGGGPSSILGLGAGYRWNNISAELRYHTNRKIIQEGIGRENNGVYSKLSFTLSYSLFNLTL